VSNCGPHRHHLDTHIDFTQTRILVDGPKFGLAFCAGRPPALPLNGKDFQLVTWKDAVHVADELVPPGSMARLKDADEIRCTADQRYFLTWSLNTAS
jgi:hypothetical protein